ncbi:MAG: gluconate 2-dehydrogenase subunit 3 family protein [Gemmatimonas sp.]
MTRPPEDIDVIHRREAIKRVSALLGGVALVGSSALWTACSGDRARNASAIKSGVGAFSPTDITFLDEVADTILPDTAKSPGAKAAQVGAFIALMVTDCYEADHQEIFRAGMTQLDAACRTAHGVAFVDATPAQRVSLLEGIDRETKTYTDARTAEQPPHYFRMVKELTLLGYFTSEIGYTKAMRYVESPGRFDPCVPYTPGETTWARHA